MVLAGCALAVGKRRLAAPLSLVAPKPSLDAVEDQFDSRHVGGSVRFVGEGREEMRQILDAGEAVDDPTQVGVGAGGQLPDLGILNVIDDHSGLLAHPMPM